MIRVLIVDDSKVVRMLLRAMLDMEDDIEVIAEAANGVEAVELTRRHRPDLITMDIRMPLMDGFEATKEIMAQCPTPILVVSASVNCQELMIAFNALEAGALGVIEKPPGLQGDDYDKVKSELLLAVRTYHEIKVVSRRKRVHKEVKPKSTIDYESQPNAGHHKVVAIGASTGGPALLADILRDIPATFPAPIAIVQHIAEGFTNGLVEWLNEISPLHVQLAEHGRVMRAGDVYIAPYGRHMHVVKTDLGQSIRLVDSASQDCGGFCPAVDELFKSLADSAPKYSIGILLTGMGVDGAAGLLSMKKAQCITFSQDEASSVVYGMPKEAKKIGACLMEIRSDKVASVLCRQVYQSDLIDEE